MNTNIFKPKNLGEYIGNTTTINKLKDSLEKNNYKGIYIISGKRGYGKSLLVELILKERGIIQIHLDMEETSKHKEYKKSLLQVPFLETAYILDNFSLKKKDGKMKYEKFQDFINEKFTKIMNNLVFILVEESGGIKKKMKNINNIFIISKIRDETIFKYIKEKLKENNFIIQKKKIEDKLFFLIQKAEGDFRSIVNSVEMFIADKHEKKSIANTEDNHNFIKNYEIDKDEELFSSVGNMYKDLSIERKMKSYFMNTMLMPLFMYDNTHKYIDTRHFKTNVKDITKKPKNMEWEINVKKNLDTLYELSYTFTDYDILDTKKRKDVLFCLDKYSCALSALKPYQIIKPIKKDGGQMILFPSSLGKMNKKSNDLKFKIKKTEMTEIEEYYYKHDKKYIYSL